MSVPFEHCPKRPCVFTDIDTGIEYTGVYIPCRVGRTTVPSGYVYECRHGDSDVSVICTLEPYVGVNFKGTFVSETPIKFSNEKDKFVNVERRWL